MKHVGVGAALVLILAGAAFAEPIAPPKPVPLWPEDSAEIADTPAAERPTLYIYPADAKHNTGACVIILPGGGYSMLAANHEGQQPARWLNSIGVTGVMLNYRRGPKHLYPEPLRDAQQAVRHVRAHAKELGVDPDRVGVWGFSAGGHLASLVSNDCDDGDPSSADPVARQGCRPDFSVLCYPAISVVQVFGQPMPTKNLLGDNRDPELLKLVSTETRVSKNTPPTFLFQTLEDGAVHIGHPLAYYQALIEHSVPAEMHLYQQGPHGLGLAPGAPGASGWKDALALWLRQNGFLTSNRQRAPAAGAVTVDGKPLQWGSIRFDPVDDPNAPAAFTIVMFGKFQFSETQGPLVGKNRLTVRSLGGLQSLPSADDFKVVIGDAGQEELILNVHESGNEFTIAIP